MLAMIQKRTNEKKMFCLNELKTKTHEIEQMRINIQYQKCVRPKSERYNLFPNAFDEYGMIRRLMAQHN